jgi:hypothetical protein
MSEITNGRHREIINGQEYNVFFAKGIKYLNITDSARYCHWQRTWVEVRISQKEKETGQKIKHNFGGRDRWVKIEDLDTYFFTPVEEQ